jgi:hypothetical protein
MKEEGRICQGTKQFSMRSFSRDERGCLNDELDTRMTKIIREARHELYTFK